VLVPLLVLAGERGAVAVALALVAEAALSTAAYLAVAARILRTSAGALAAALRPAVLAAIPMALFLQAWLGIADASPAPAALTVGALGGMTSYGVTLRLVAPSVYRDAAGALRRGRRTAPPQAARHGPLSGETVRP
jgi:hypothetical protein